MDSGITKALHASQCIPYPIPLKQQEHSKMDFWNISKKLLPSMKKILHEQFLDQYTSVKART